MDLDPNILRQVQQMSREGQKNWSAVEENLNIEEIVLDDSSIQAIAQDLIRDLTAVRDGLSMYSGSIVVWGKVADQTLPSNTSRYYLVRLREGGIGGRQLME